MSCGVGHRCDLDLTLLWLWCTALIQPLAWEPPYAGGAALEKAKRQKKEKKKFLRQRNWAMELMWEMIPGGSNVGNRAREEKKPNKA